MPVTAWYVPSTLTPVVGDQYAFGHTICVRHLQSTIIQEQKSNKLKNFKWVSRVSPSDIC